MKKYFYIIGILILLSGLYIQTKIYIRQSNESCFLDAAIKLSLENSTRKNNYKRDNVFNNSFIMDHYEKYQDSLNILFSEMHKIYRDSFEKLKFIDEGNLKMARWSKTIGLDDLENEKIIPTVFDKKDTQSFKYLDISFFNLLKADSVQCIIDHDTLQGNYFNCLKKEINNDKAKISYKKGIRKYSSSYLMIDSDIIKN